MDRLLSEIPAPLFDEWMAFYSLDPWGETRADLRAAMLTSFVHNWAGAEPKTTVQDFMPYLDRPAPPSPEELQERLLAKFGLGPDGLPLHSSPRPVVHGEITDSSDGENNCDSKRVAQSDAKTVPEQIVHGSSC